MVKLRWPRSWSPSSRLSFKLKELKGASGGGGGAGFEGRVEGADLAGALAAVGARFEAEDLARFLFGKSCVPGIELGVDRVDRAGGRSRHQAAFAGEEMELEVFEGSLGQVGEFGGQLAGDRVGFDGADELDVHAEAGGGLEEAVLVAGLGFAEVDGAFEALGQGRGADREGADLGGVGTVGRAFGVEVGLGFGAFGLTVGGVGVDREAFGQGDGCRFDLGGLGGEGEELGGAEVDVQARGGVGLGRWSGRPGGPA